MNQEIIKAITDCRLLQFTYKGTQRWVEPHTYGRQPNGKEGLCAWQTVGGSGEDFRFYLEQGMTNIAAGDESFTEPRPGYHRGDPRFLHIYAEL